MLRNFTDFGSISGFLQTIAQCEIIVGRQAEHGDPFADQLFQRLDSGVLAGDQVDRGPVVALLVGEGIFHRRDDFQRRAERNRLQRRRRRGRRQIDLACHQRLEFRRVVVEARQFEFQPLILERLQFESGPECRHRRCRLPAETHGFWWRRALRMRQACRQPAYQCKRGEFHPKHFRPSGSAIAPLSVVFRRMPAGIERPIMMRPPACAGKPAHRVSPHRRSKAGSRARPSR